MMRGRGIEELSFSDAIEAENSRLANEVLRMLSEEDYQSFAHQHYSYLSRSEYVDQLRRWFEYFDVNRFYIESAEEFYRDPASTLRSIYEFLELPCVLPEHFPVIRKGSNELVMSEDESAFLREYFFEKNEDLFKLLGRRFSWNE
jgi:hypothetical protein